jgi:hypothetical protein
MSRENHILHQGMVGIHEKDLELQVLYGCLSEAEHGLNHTRTQLELVREEVDMRTHTIVHLENAVEMKDLELNREEKIATLVQ